MSHYISYYNEQIGGGGGVGSGSAGVQNVFTGASYQRGRGVGAWLGGLFRKILPYVTSGAKAVGKEAMRAGINVLDDVANNGANFKEAFKLRATESGKQLRRKAAEKMVDLMKGSGYKSGSPKRRRQSRNTRVSGSVGAARKKKARGIKKRKSGKSIKKKRQPKKKQKKKATTFRNITDIFGPQ